MTSLSEAYGGRGRSEVDPRRLYLGVGLFVGGGLLLVVGILTAAEVLSRGGLSSGAARRYGGILGGLGVPIVMLGIMTVLPADRNTRSAAVVGAAIMGLGVALFAHAYPAQWVGGPRPELLDLTLPTAGVYFLGAATTLWCLFVGVANFKTRNDPGGTVTMEVTHKGETKVIEVERDQIGGLGGVGLLGATPDGEVETQTNRGGSAGRDGPSSSSGQPSQSSSSQSSPSQSSSSQSSSSQSSSSQSSPSQSPTSPSSSSDDSRSADGGTGGFGGTRTASGGAASGFGGPSGVSDGGSTAADISSPLDEPRTSTMSGASTSTEKSTSPRDGPVDTYCGNCARFDYVRTEDGMRPYCGHYDEIMDGMDACDQWVPR